MALHRTHDYQKDCCCPTCADDRARLRLAVIVDFINWANAPLLAGMRRATENRLKPKGLDVPIEVWKSAGFKSRNGVENVRLGVAS